MGEPDPFEAGETVVLFPTPLVKLETSKTRRTRSVGGRQTVNTDGLQLDRGVCTATVEVGKD
jgi:hypothetical protein